MLVPILHPQDDGFAQTKAEVNGNLQQFLLGKCSVVPANKKRKRKRKEILGRVSNTSRFRKRSRGTRTITLLSNRTLQHRGFNCPVKLSYFPKILRTTSVFLHGCSPAGNRYFRLFFSYTNTDSKDVSPVIARLGGLFSFLRFYSLTLFRPVLNFTQSMLQAFAIQPV